MISENLFDKVKKMDLIQNEENNFEKFKFLSFRV